jgi:predicted transport protein
LVTLDLTGRGLAATVNVGQNFIKVVVQQANKAVILQMQMQPSKQAVKGFIYSQGY